MKQLTLIALSTIAAVALVISLVLNYKNSEWSRLIKEGDDAHYYGNYDKARAAYQQAFNLCSRQNLDVRAQIICLNNLAKVSTDKAIAEAIYEKALDLEEKTYGKNSLQQVGTLVQLASVIEDRHEIRKATQYYELAFSILKQNPEKHPAEAELCLNQLLQIYQKAGELQKARHLLQTELWMASYEPTPAIVNRKISCLNKLAKISTAEKKYSEAADYLDQNRLASIANQPEDWVQIYTYPIEIADLYYKASDFENAEKFYLLALSNAEKCKAYPKGSDKEIMGSTLVVSAAYNLALFYDLQGNFFKALPLYQLYFASYRNWNNSLPCYRPLELNKKIDFISSTNQREMEQTLIEHNLQVSEDVLGCGHPLVTIFLFQLAQLKSSEHDLNESNVLMQRALKSERLARPGSPQTVNILVALGENSLRQKQPPQALKYFRKAHQLNKPGKAGFYSNDNICRQIGHLYVLQGNQQAAKPFLDEALREYTLTLTTLERQDGGNSPSLSPWLCTCAEVCYDQKDTGKATGFLKRALLLEAQADDGNQSQLKDNLQYYISFFSKLKDKTTVTRLTQMELALNGPVKVTKR